MKEIKQKAWHVAYQWAPIHLTQKVSHTESFDEFQGSTLHPVYCPETRYKSHLRMFTEQQTACSAKSSFIYNEPPMCLSGMVWILFKCKWPALRLRRQIHSDMCLCAWKLLFGKVIRLSSYNLNTTVRQSVLIILFWNNKDIRKYGIQRVSALGRSHDFRKGTRRKIKSQLFLCPACFSRVDYVIPFETVQKEVQKYTFLFLF